MNKKLIALLALAGLSASASSFAGTVRLSGNIDNSIQVMKAKGESTVVEQATNQIYSSGIHLDATEDFGNGYGVESKVWFVISPDDGSIASPDGALANHVVVAVKTPYGKVGAGRFGAFGSAIGPIGRWWYTDPFFNGIGDAGPQATTNGIYGEPLRNSIYYESPDLSGAKLGLVYSLTEENNAEGASQNDNTTFWEVFSSYQNGPLLLMADVQGNHYGHASAYRHLGNRFRAKVSGSYEMGSWTVYGGWSYGRNEIKFNGSAWGNRPDFKYDASNPDKDGMNGRALDMQSAYVAVKKTIGAWDLQALGQMQWGENKGQSASKTTDPKFRRYVGSIGANYNFSNRTTLYSVASFSFTGKGWKEGQAAALERRMFILGIAHTF